MDRKMMLLIIGFTNHHEKYNYEKNKEVIKEEWINFLKQSDDEYDPWSYEIVCDTKELEEAIKIINLKDPKS